MKKLTGEELTKEDLAYISGFLDSNNCELSAKIIRHNYYTYKFKIELSLLFYVKIENYVFVRDFFYIFGYCGNLYRKEKGIWLLTVKGSKCLLQVLPKIKDYIKIKKSLVDLLLEIIKEKENIKSLEDFIKVCKLIDKFNNLKIYGNSYTYQDAELNLLKNMITENLYNDLLKNFIKVKDFELKNSIKIMKSQKNLFLDGNKIKEAKTSVDVINYWKNKNK